MALFIILDLDWILKRYHSARAAVTNLSRNTSCWGGTRNTWISPAARVLQNVAERKVINTTRFAAIMPALWIMKTAGEERLVASSRCGGYGIAAHHII